MVLDTEPRTSCMLSKSSIAELDNAHLQPPFYILVWDEGLTKLPGLVLEHEGTLLPRSLKQLRLLMCATVFPNIVCLCSKQ